MNFELVKLGPWITPIFAQLISTKPGNPILVSIFDAWISSDDTTILDPYISTLENIISPAILVLWISTSGNSTSSSILSIPSSIFNIFIYF